MSVRSFNNYVMSKFPDGTLTPTNQWNITCPRCRHHNAKCFIDMKNGASWCHHCEWKASNWWFLIAYVEHLSNTAAAQRWFESKTQFSEYQYELPTSPADIKQYMLRQLPAEYRPIYAFNPYETEGPWDLGPAKKYAEYLDNRGFYVNDIYDNQIGYCDSGYYEGRLIMPVINYGVLEFFCDRTIDKEEIRKTLGVGNKSHAWPSKKSSVIFHLEKAEERIQKDGHIDIAEGIISALSVNSSCIGLLGKRCSSVQLKRILDLNPTSATIHLDPDAQKERAELAFELKRHGVEKVEICNYTEGDPNDYKAFGIDQEGWEFPKSYEFDMMAQMTASMKGWIKEH
jgi:hypothetical protein